MNIWHNRLLHLQAVVLVIAAAFALLAPALLLPFIIVFFLMEIAVLETQRRENPLAMRYQKGCFFALLDLASVLVFLYCFGRQLYLYFAAGAVYSPCFLTALLLYIALRKLYILKNYSYEIA